MKRKRRRYDDKFKASAIAMLAGAGYPDNPFKLEEVAKHLDMPSRTLRRWFTGDYGAPPDNVVKEGKKELADVFESIAYKMLDHAGQADVIDDMSGKDAVIAAATATDKMRLLQGMPTEIVAVMPEFVQVLQKAGKDPKEFMNRVINRLSDPNYVQ